MPPNPITGKKRTGKIEVELDGYAVEIEFKKKAGDKIEKKLSLYSTEDGEKLDQPRARLDAIIGTLEFDPFKFMRMQPKPQLEYFCKVFGVKGIKALDDDEKELNEVINFDKKELDAIKAQLQPYDTKLAEAELKSASDLATELETANRSQCHDHDIRGQGSRRERQPRGAQDRTRRDQSQDQGERGKDRQGRKMARLTNSNRHLRAHRATHRHRQDERRDQRGQASKRVARQS